MCRQTSPKSGLSRLAAMAAPLGLLLAQLHNKTGHLPGKRFIVFFLIRCPHMPPRGQHKAVLRHLLNLGALAKPRNIPIGTLHSLPSSPFGGHP